MNNVNNHSFMNVLKNIIEVIDEINITEQEIEPLQKRLNDNRKSLSELNEKLPFMYSLRDFLAEKIIETYSEDELKALSEYRRELKSLTSYSSNKTFDPLYDSWYIYDYERKGDKIRIKVSCKKNEGSISGLMTFLDTHYSSWFEMSELETIN